MPAMADAISELQQAGFHYDKCESRLISVADTQSRYLITSVERLGLKCYQKGFL
jgi:hypothetical protein